VIPFRQRLKAGAGITLLTPPQAVRPDVGRHSSAIVLASLVFGLALWAALAVQPPANPNLRPGQPSPVNIQARHSVTYVSEWRTEQNRSRAESAPDTVVYARDLNILTQQRLILSDLLQSITQIRDDPTLRPAERRAKLAALPNSTLVISDALAFQIAGLTEAGWSETRKLTLDLYDRGVGEYRFALDEQAVNQLRNYSLPYWASLQVVPDEDGALAVTLVSAHLRPNLVIDEEATRARKAAVREAVKPVSITILQGESIVRPGDVVTPDVQEKLEALGELRLEIDWYAVAGKGIFSFLLAVGFGVYIGLTQRQQLGSIRPLMMIVVLSVATIVLARFLAVSGWNWLYAFPLALIGLLLAALFNTSLALFMIGLLVLPIAISGGGLLPGFTLLIGSVAGIFAIGRGERSRSFIVAGMAVAVATALAAVGLALAESGAVTPDELAVRALLGVLNGAISTVIALGLYNAVGHIAGVVTPLQLMELAHPAQPLLRKLIREAPGTYYHSVAVGNLAESAAEAIGADALLLRVASYYHDIGKTIRPFFFTDNQSDRENVHNDLDPETSADIIAGHVREGVVLARKAGLPEPIIDFIATHHGTSVIKHFYQLALQQSDTVDIERFRYPGPRPQTREQAVMMLADTVEATVRSKFQYGKIISSRDGSGRHSDAQTLAELVGSIIDERIKSGQIDESPLTLQDLARIRQAFVTTLQGIYHPRVEYTPQIVRTQ
jgi:putative nucleotidyltransferase with HDIG domain